MSQGHSCRTTAHKFAVSVSTAIRLGVKVCDGEDLSAHKLGRKEGTGKFAPFRAFLVERVETRSDITLRELVDARDDAYGITAALSSIWNALDRFEFTLKKSLMASEIGREGVRDQRDPGFVTTSHACPNMPGRLHFIDETGVTTKMTRLQ